MITSMGNQHQLLYISNKSMGPNDLPVTIDLPYNYDKVYFRFLTKDERAPKQFVTNDINEWFEFLGQINRVEHFSVADIYTTHAITYNHTIFPDFNNDVDNGRFSLQFSCTKKEI